jgi:hydroxyacylglutathione hydrolase
MINNVSWKIHCVPAFEDNYIWLIGSEGSPTVAAVDPGDADPVMDYLEQHNLILDAILLTHHHYDHTGGVGELTARYSAKVYGPANEPIPAINQAVREGDVIDLHGLQLRVLDTPGHTRGHVCYTNNRLLFCGDTLFGAGCGRLFEGTPEQMYLSLQKIAALPDETLIYCAHEYTLDDLKFALVAEPDNPDMLERQCEALELRRQGVPTVPSTLSLEKKTNPFLRTHIGALKAAAEAFAGHPLASGAEVFATVRRWKDALD